MSEDTGGSAYSPRELLVAFVAATLAIALHLTGFLLPVENAAIDTAARLSPIRVEKTFLVLISDEDYRNPELFSGRSPLDASKVYQLIAAIDRAHPKGIVAGLDTSDASFANVVPPATDSPVIWARAATIAGARTANGALRFVVGKDKGAPLLKMDNVLGKPYTAEPVSALPEARGPSGLMGLSVLLTDPDGVLRYYYNHFPTVDPSGNVRETDSVWRLAASLVDSKSSTGDGSARVMRLALSENDIPSVTAADCLKLADLHEGNPFKDKIVVLGGKYGSGRDLYMTAAGPMYGAEVIAQAIEAEATHQSKDSGSLFLICASVLLCALAYQFLIKRRTAATIALVGTPVVGAIVAAIFWNAAHQWFNFVPAAASVYLCALLNHIQSLKQRNIELQTMNDELARARWELANAIDRGAEQQRKDIADGLHDEMLPKLQHAANLLEPLTERDISIDGLEPALSTLRDARVRMRRLMKGLNPPSLESGLVDAIDDLILETESLNIKFRPANKDVLDQLDKDSRRRLFRIVQEAINNIDKHAEASEAQISLAVHGDQLTLTIADNGKGFSDGKGGSGSYGLHGMRSKAELLNAEISWSSPNEVFGRGTAVTLRMPIKKHIGS